MTLRSGTGSAETRHGLLGQGNQSGVLGGSRPTGWNLAPGHVPKAQDLPKYMQPGSIREVAKIPGS